MFFRSRRFRRIARLAVMVGACSTVACYTYQPVGALRASDRLPADVVVYRYTGSVVQLATARIASDTIYGKLFRGSTTETKIPLAHVDSIIYKKLEPRRTAMMVIGAFLFYHFTLRYIKAQAPGSE